MRISFDTPSDNGRTQRSYELAWIEAKLPIASVKSRLPRSVGVDQLIDRAHMRSQPRSAGHLDDLQGGQVRRAGKMPGVAIHCAQPVVHNGGPVIWQQRLHLLRTRVVQHAERGGNAVSPIVNQKRVQQRAFAPED
jgi:hypothetical protein